jgi:Flp pilus assembly protein TadG
MDTSMFIDAIRRRLGRDRRSRGQSLVEFAIVIPLFLLLLFALIDMGRLVYINNALAQGAREGARWGAVDSRAASAANRTAVGTRTASSLTAVPNPTVTVSCFDRVTGAPEATCEWQDVLVVQIDSPVTMLTPLVSQIVGPQTFTAVSKVTVN